MEELQMQCIKGVGARFTSSVQMNKSFCSRFSIRIEIRLISNEWLTSAIMTAKIFSGVGAK